MSTESPSSDGVAPYRELTPAAVILGAIIGCLMTAAFVYIGLKLGFGLPGSTVAAILGFGVLRGVLKKGTIVENNINQTIASGVNNASAGIVFTLPALFLLHGEAPRPLPFILAAIAGSFLGIVIIIPLRKQMIEFERLRFPSGIAVASILKSPGAGAQQAVLLGIGFLVAAIPTLLTLLHKLPHDLNLGVVLNIPQHIPIIFGVTFASLGAGLLSGRGGLPFVAGGVLAWWVISPIAVAQGWTPQLGALDLPAGVDPSSLGEWQMWEMYGTMLRPLGIGILIGGAIAGVIASLPALKAAITSLAQAAKMGGGDANEELSTKVIYGGMIGGVAVLFLVAVTLVDGVSVAQALGVALIGGLWLALAGLIVAQATGMTDISPLSGMALIAVTLMYFITGGNVTASVMLGVAVCIGIGQCADMMSDLKSGHLIGATPRKQQIAQFAVAWIGVPVAVGVVYLLWGDGGGFGPGTDLTAPQASALQNIIGGLQGGDSAVDKYAAGGAIGLALGAYPISGIGVLVGLAMYLPISITLTYGLGCIAAIGLKKAKGQRWIASTLVPIAAGFIIGEALTSLVFNLVKMATG